MSEVPGWFERKFEFNFPVGQYPNLSVRLRGTPARLEEMLSGVPREALIHKPAGKWSAQEHAGHLLDLESLWLARVDDFLGNGDALTFADLTNRKTNEAKHNDSELNKALLNFRNARFALLDRLKSFQPSDFARTKLHPRLKQPMRLVDHLYFIAEHDDHHLAKIREIVGERHCATQNA